MKASSESGLWALTISWGAADVISGVDSSQFTPLSTGTRGEDAKQSCEQNEKGRSSDATGTGKVVDDHPICACYALPVVVAADAACCDLANCNPKGVTDPTVQSARTAVPPRQMRPPPFWSGSICHLPPALGGPANESRRGIKTGLIPPSLCSRLLFLSIA